MRCKRSRISLADPAALRALFIVGETGLARTLASRPSSIGLLAQVCSHIHLRPLDLDEARDLLDSADLADVGDRWMLEELHRQSHGNTALLLRLAQTWNEPRPGDHGLVSARSPRLSIGGVTRGARPPATDAADEARPDSSGEIVKQQNGSTGQPEGDCSARGAGDYSVQGANPG